jgi:adenine C2-methylase RlmN of 23S rRNA A2503 and tRNA A37
VLEELEAGSGIRFGKKTEVQLRISAHAAKFVSRRPLFLLNAWWNGTTMAA